MAVELDFKNLRFSFFRFLKTGAGAAKFQFAYGRQNTKASAENSTR